MKISNKQPKQTPGNQKRWAFYRFKGGSQENIVVPKLDRWLVPGPTNDTGKKSSVTKYILKIQSRELKITFVFGKKKDIQSMRSVCYTCKKQRVFIQILRRALYKFSDKTQREIIDIIQNRTTKKGLFN